MLKRFVTNLNKDFRVKRRRHLAYDMWDKASLPGIEYFYDYALQYQILPFIWITIQIFYDDEEWVAKAQAEEALHYLTIND